MCFDVSSNVTVTPDAALQAVESAMEVNQPAKSSPVKEAPVKQEPVPVKEEPVSQDEDVEMETAEEEAKKQDKYFKGKPSEKHQLCSSQGSHKLCKITKKVPCMEKSWNLKKKKLNNHGKTMEFYEI